MAISGIALAGSLDTTTDTGTDTGTGDATVTADVLGRGPQAADPTTGQIRIAPVTTPAPSDASLVVSNPDVTVNADEPVEVGFQMTDPATGRPLADQDILVQAQFPAGWTTFKALRTDAAGNSSYTARVLTTTQVRAVFNGTPALKGVTSDAGVIRVRPQAAAPAPSAGQAFRAAVRTALPAAPATAPPATSTLGQRAVYLASLQAGKPYVYGATGPYSFDCSSLIQYVFKQLGRSLPRTTNQQYAATARVARGSEQVGDLIFFGEPGNIYHMGLYAGDGKIWAAPKTGDVVKLQTIWTSSYSVGRVL
ncbi:C40 family peptidase [Candidatus Protofrankia californiensis]|uniref:C40 family peptidase n=1 Tax=Candidatus Protofrankia californiensis TaxID=1839754 RepID=UPI00104197B0|nr:C40 family peptidase [Candidatus Protofrankia californiensis]